MTVAMASSKAEVHDGELMVAARIRHASSKKDEKDANTTASELPAVVADSNDENKPAVSDDEAEDTRRGREEEKEGGGEERGGGEGVGRIEAFPNSPTTSDPEPTDLSIKKPTNHLPHQHNNNNNNNNNDSPPHHPHHPHLMEFSLQRGLSVKNFSHATAPSTTTSTSLPASLAIKSSFSITNLLRPLSKTQTTTTREDRAEDLSRRRPVSPLPEVTITPHRVHNIPKTVVKRKLDEVDHDEEDVVEDDCEEEEEEEEEDDDDDVVRGETTSIREALMNGDNIGWSGAKWCEGRTRPTPPGS
ncbi:hypothetical protein Pmani_014471 [Petrolisthes manimaculis]|uniref:Uncharacterized protein n=1 Tax=Petrolisthes manimaculis TaxID=1843537 RepID=A0AAE1PU91_9EUCA|nr:hypothetical protein Pmani_014471 [Petrolisthes manimaculis]